MMDKLAQQKVEEVSLAGGFPSALLYIFDLKGSVTRFSILGFFL
jgi:hypothetical protein